MHSEEILIRAGIFAGFAGYLAGRGLTSDVGLSALRDFEQELPMTEVEAVFARASAALGDPCLGLHWAEAYPLGASGVYGYLLKNTETLGDALAVVERYLALFARPVRVSVTQGRDVSMLAWHTDRKTAAAAPQTLTFSVALTVLRLAAVAGSDWRPRAVHLIIDPLPCTETLTRIFGPNVVFGSETNTVVVDAAYLTCGPAKTDRRLFSLIKELGDRMLAEQPRQDEAVSLVQKEIVDRLETGDLSLDVIADALCLPPRTLQAKLAQAGTSFEAVLNDTRAAFARHYLVDTQVPLTEIAMLLGFSELSAFTRAAQRWFGMAPSAYRRQYRRAGL